MRLGALVGSILAAPSIVAAQGKQPCVFDTAAHRDTGQITLYVRVHQVGDTTLNLAATRLIGALLRERWHPPATAGRMFYPYTTASPALEKARPSPSDIHAVPRDYGRFLVRLNNDSVVFVAVESTTGDSATDSSFVAALGPAAANTGGRNPVSDHRASRALLRADLFETTDGGNEPIIRFAVPRIEYDQPVQQHVGRRGPLYPVFERQSGIDGEATIRFVIDESGRVEAGSMYAIDATRQAFADAAKDVPVLHIAGSELKAAKEAQTA